MWMHKPRARSVKDCSPLSHEGDDIWHSYFLRLMEFYVVLLPLLFIAQLTIQ